MVKATRIRFGLAGEFRKTTIPDGLTLVELESMVQKMFELSPSATIKIRYKDDDGAMITVGDDDELNLVMEDFETLKFDVTVSEAKIEGAAQQQQHQQQLHQQLPQQQQQPLPQQQQQQLPQQQQQQLPQQQQQQQQQLSQQQLLPPEPQLMPQQQQQQQQLPPPQQQLPPPQQQLPPPQQHQFPPPPPQQQIPPPPLQYIKNPAGTGAPPLQPPVYQSGYAPNPYSARKRY